MIGIYRLVNKINGKIYIGQSSNLDARKWSHFTGTIYKSPKYHGYYTELGQDFRLYGKENFVFEIIEECSLEELDDKENYWINYYDSYNAGYNLTLGGRFKNFTTVLIDQYDLDGNFIKTFNSLTEIKNTFNFSTYNISSCCTNKLKSIGGYQWRYHGDPPPGVYQDNKYNHTTSSNCRIVQQYTKNNSFIKEYKSAHAAARGIDKPQCANHITECCQGKRKTCNGFIWKYKSVE